MTNQEKALKLENEASLLLHKFVEKYDAFNGIYPSVRLERIHDKISSRYWRRWNYSLLLG